MIYYIEGILKYKEQDYIVVDSSGIGYQIFVALSVINSLPAIESEIKVYTHFYVRDDNLALYGFLDREDLDIFKNLITVSGIGPKGALNILSVLTPKQLGLAIINNDVDRITAAKGIGKKTASKLIIELKDKLQISMNQSENQVDTGGQEGESSVYSELVSALLGLGYSNLEVNKALKNLPQNCDLESGLKYALKYLSL